MVNVDGRDVIQIEVGRHMIDDPNKGEIPEFYWGTAFEVQVEWVGPFEGLVLTLSDFRVVSADQNPPDDASSIWTEDGGVKFSLEDGDNKPLEQVVFASSEAVETPRSNGEEHSEEMVFITKKTLILNIARRPESERKHLLVLFKQTLSGVLFEIDPPWAGKPPTG